jgi:exodeoxyribonuclease V beta subunit
MTKKAFMEKSRKFDLIKSPLEGANLIEASAGTGKTYAITGIFLRLLLEKGLSVGEILVVTYTVAATEELRDRIRRTIYGAIQGFGSGTHEDPFLDGLVKHYGTGTLDSKDECRIESEMTEDTVIPDQGGIDRDKIIRRLRAALRDFDEAPIYTIHGFCGRALHENAFESMGLFDTELVPDERTLSEEVVRDFWRNNFYEGPREVVSYCLNKRFNPKSILALIKGRLFDTDMRIIPAAHPVSFDALPPFREDRENLCGAWRGARDDMAVKLSDPGLHRGRYKNPETLIAMMDGYVDSETPLPLFKGFEKFTSSYMEKNTNKGKTTPKHPFFDDCEEFSKIAAALEAQMEGHLLFLKADVFRYVRQELRKRKQQQNIQSFDDLLFRLREALDKSGSKELIRNIRGRYRAALIDEFQDTDPVQYAIFQRIFGKESTVFYIGDPKQSIYSFRGADLFAYMRASRDVDTRYSLSYNWRSEPELVEAVNAVFENPEVAAFLYDEVPFERVAAGNKKDRKLFMIGGRRQPPFHIWFLDGMRLRDAGAQTNQEYTAHLIIRAVAAEISRLLHLGREGKATIGDEPLSEGHIAVLVRENRRARLVQDVLGSCGIPSVLHSAGNLFDAHEALEMGRLLNAVAEPHNEGLVRIALATDMVGVTGEDLDRMRDGEQEWEEGVARFREYNQLWERYGFIAMFRHLLAKEGVRRRLLAFPDGERRLTNVLHLMEVLHTEAVGQKLGMRSLIKWLTSHRDSDTPRLEEHELRLESDARAVKIVTIHKSKGLEYPIVFSPFNWGGSKSRSEEFTYHDPEDAWRLNLVLHGGGGADSQLADKERLSENIRLLYVSLTRAKNRCYVAWGPFKEAGTSALAYILHPPKEVVADVVTDTERAFATLSDDDMRRDLEAIAVKSGGAVMVSDLPEFLPEPYRSSEEPPEILSCRKFTGVIDRHKRMASFSSLVAERIYPPGVTPEDASELPDRDEGARATETPSRQELTGIFAFPKGAKAGNLLHDILEHVDFTTLPQAEETKNVVAEKLKQHGFDSQWQETVYSMIGRVVSAPLQFDPDSLTLSAVANDQRLNELEFYFPINRLTPHTLTKIFEECAMAPGPAFSGKIGRLNFQPVRGFMKGFIDLVFRHDGRFYLLDWKSNFMGPSVDDYTPGALASAMKEELYVLQYHLYAVAVDRYLKVRLPEYDYDAHFGGVFYVFLRGVDPATGKDTGIYRDRPAKETIEYLGKKLIAK